MVTRRLPNAVNKTYHAASLRELSSTRPMIAQKLECRIPSSSTFFGVYSFTRSCGSVYIGRTSRRLSERVKEHHPAWIGSGMNKTITSGVVAHLVDCNHVVNVNSAFVPIYRVSHRYTHGVNSQMFAAAEAIAIRFVSTEAICSVASPAMSSN